MDFDSLVDDREAQAPAPQAAPSPQEQSKPLMFDQLQEDKPEPTGLNFDDLVDDSEKHSTTGQQILTGIEGVGRGLSGGLTDALAVGMRKGATALGVPDEHLHYVAPAPKEISARKEENPIIAGSTELAGNIALMSKLPQVGSKAVNGMIQMGLIAGGDEISKSMLGQGEPTEAVASHIAGSMAAGLVGGKIFSGIEKLGSKSLQAIENAKIGNKISSFLSGVGRAASLPGEGVVSLKNSSFVDSAGKKFDDAAFKYGQQVYKTYFENMPKAIGRSVAPTAGAFIGHTAGGTAGAIGGAAASMAMERALEKIAPKLSQKYIAPAVLRAAASGKVENIGKVIDHATQIEKGAKKISNHVENVFKAGSNKLVDSQTSERDREKLKEFIENGGVDQQIREEQLVPEPAMTYAKGGKVSNDPTPNQPDPIAEIFPDQSMLLASTKGRVSGYLNSVRPKPNQAKLPFDTDKKDKNKDRDYDKMLDLANNPLSILNHVKEGTLLPKHMEAFTQMYPELHGHLSKKLTERMLKGQLKNETRPPYKVRQALSLFLGTSLDSTLTPMGMMAAQNVFAQQKAQNPAPGSNASGLDKLGKRMQTAEQSRTQDLTK